MSGRRSRDKGLRTERGIVKAMTDAGFAAERMPLSGAAGGRFAGDISWPFLGRDRIIECKCRSDGFKFLYESLSEHYGLIVKADNRKPLMVIPLDEFLRVAGLAELSKDLKL